jgi:hypothetical protein
MGYYGHAFKLTIYYLCIIDDIKDKKYEYIMNKYYKIKVIEKNDLKEDYTHKLVKL